MITVGNELQNKKMYQKLEVINRVGDQNEFTN